MKVRMLDIDGASQIRYITPKNFDPKRMIKLSKSFEERLE